jgi:inosose dehydratase
MSSRRDFVTALGAVAAGFRLPLDRLGLTSRAPLYPPMDLSRFDRSVTPAPADIRFGYAAITWGGDDLKAIEEIAAVGFRGIQIRSNILQSFGARPAALRELLERRGLAFVALSSGAVNPDPALGETVVSEHASHAKFVHDAGGAYLQVTDQRPANRAPTAADYTRLGGLLTGIGRRSADLGVPLGYHPHVGSMGEKPAEVDRVLDASDPRYVKLLLDVAHYQQGGGDPVEAVRRYRERLLFLHIKDVQSPAPDGKAPFRFVELGRGSVDLPAIFAALDEIRFRGWAVVELDSVPDAGGSPKESALISRKYLEERLGVRFETAVQPDDAPEAPW